jgi:hypothetical protein
LRFRVLELRANLRDGLQLLLVLVELRLELRKLFRFLFLNVQLILQQNERKKEGREGMSRQADNRRSIQTETEENETKGKKRQGIR